MYEHLSRVESLTRAKISRSRVRLGTSAFYHPPPLAYHTFFWLSALLRAATPPLPILTFSLASADALPGCDHASHDSMAFERVVWHDQLATLVPLLSGTQETLKTPPKVFKFWFDSMSKVQVSFVQPLAQRPHQPQSDRCRGPPCIERG